MSLVTVQVLLKNTFKALHTVSVELDIILVSKIKNLGNIQNWKDQDGKIAKMKIEDRLGQE